MKNFENPAPLQPVPSEESGIRRIDEKERRKYEEQKHKIILQKIKAKAEEVHPEDPWEEFGPKDESNTAEVWGMTEEEREEIERHDEEDAQINAEIRKPLSELRKRRENEEQEEKAVLIEKKRKEALGEEKTLGDIPIAYPAKKKRRN